MNQVIFSKKHIVVSIGLGVIVLLVVTGIWLMLVLPAMGRVDETRVELNKLKASNKNSLAELEKLVQNPTLFESQAVTDIPEVPNGMNLETYFKELQDRERESTITILNMRFEDFSVYPEDEKAEKQLRKSQIGFDITGESEKDIISFVDRMEQGTRFIKIKDITYRADDSKDVEKYSATIILEMYYLSLFETGKVIE